MLRLLLVLIALVAACGLPAPAARPAGALRPEVAVLVDDFRPQRYGGGEPYAFNRLDGDRGALPGSQVAWGDGSAIVTVAEGAASGGFWTSLNHLRAEGHAIDLGALLPAPIAPAYQSRAVGLTVQVVRGAPQASLRAELWDGATRSWSATAALSGGPQTIRLDLPGQGTATELRLLLEGAAPGALFEVSRIVVHVTNPISDTATAAFVWSYALLLRNWDPDTGLVRDKARVAGGQFDAIQATGSLAAATALARQLGVVAPFEAAQIVQRIARALLVEVPRHRGLLPHFVVVTPGEGITIAPGTEWSSVDTLIAGLGLLTAQSGLGLNPSGAEELLAGIDWADLTAANGVVAHGYGPDGVRLASVWDVFGGESWLVDLAYAAATGEVAPLGFPAPPTANGSGFIDELAWLLVPPPERADVWGADWPAYRAAAAAAQVGYFPTQAPGGCLARLGLFGLSAAEMPPLGRVAPGSEYQALGVGGRFAITNDGTAAVGSAVVTPHYAGLAAGLRPAEATAMWAWLIAAGLFSPLNNVESLTFAEGAACAGGGATWSHQKGSWNLALQTLGWGRYLSERGGQVPLPWRGALANPLLRAGYGRLAPGGPPAMPTVRRAPLGALWGHPHSRLDLWFRC